MQLVHPDARNFAQTVNSYWEASADPLTLALPPLAGESSCEVAIIGAGFTGLAAAIELAQNGVDVCVLEAGSIGWGASGRNGGFACIGSHKLSYGKMIKTYGLKATQDYHRAMRESVDLVNDNALRHDIDIWKHGQGEVTLAHLPNRIDAFREEQAFHKETFGENLELWSSADLRERGLSGPRFFGGLYSATGFGIHPLNYVRGLARAANNTGVRLHPGSRLTRWQESGGQHHLYTEQGRLMARRVLVATNGYTPEDVCRLHRGRILPALSNILVTRPLSDDELAAQGWTSSIMAYDSRNLLHYFRLLPNGRFLFGGRGGTNSSDASGQTYRAHLTNTFHSLFPAWKSADITHFWRGFVCLSYDLVPFIGALDEKRSVWTALAYHGNGVAMASWSGHAVARLILGKATEAEVPAVLTRRLARFPLPAFRPLYLKGAYLWFGWQDSR